MMKTNLLSKALEATIELHKSMLTDCCYEGYDGTKDDFDNLYEEVYVICREELPDEADAAQVIETFHEYQLEQMNGEREIGWYLYR
jgi:hypothetical protein